MEKVDLTRYDKFKENNLPTPFNDDERSVLEYVWFDDTGLNVSQNLTYALEHVSNTGLYYSYSVDGKHSHGHSFEEVLMSLYKYPETFKIDIDEEEYYSKQELEEINDIQEYLLSIGLEDIKDASITRYRTK